MDESSPPPGDVHPARAAASAQPGPAVRARDEVWSGYIGRAAGGDQEALASLYDESSGLVYAIALRMLGHVQDAEEVTLSVYAQVWRNAAEFDPARGSASGWLVMLARSRAIDRRRSRETMRRSEEPIDESAEAQAFVEAPEEATYLEEKRRMIRRALDALAAEQRQLIELAFFSGFTQSELAARLGLPLGTVKTRMRLGMMKLRDLLKPALGGW